MLARVGQAFLHDPVGGAADRRLAAAGLDPRAHAHPRRARLLDQRRDRVERRLRRLRRRPRAVAQHADHLAQVLQRRRGRSRGSRPRPRRSPPAARPGGTPARPRARDSSESRCASTSCISPAIRRRSASRACSTCARCSASSRRARSCEVRSRSRCVRANRPQRTTTAVNSTRSARSSSDGTGRPVGYTSGTTPRPTTERERDRPTIARREPRSATLNSAISAGAGREGRDDAGDDRDQRDRERAAAPPPQRDRARPRRARGRSSDHRRRSARSSVSPSTSAPIAEREQEHRASTIQSRAVRLRARLLEQRRRGASASARRSSPRSVRPRGAARPPTEVDPGIDRAAVVSAPAPRSRCCAAMIEATGLTKRLGGRTVVSDVSFRCEPGTVTGFLGPNGAGKTTTMRMLVGLSDARRGRARPCSAAHYRELAEPGPPRRRPARRGRPARRAAAAARRSPSRRR